MNKYISAILLIISITHTSYASFGEPSIKDWEMFNTCKEGQGPTQALTTELSLHELLNATVWKENKYSKDEALNLEEVIKSEPQIKRILQNEEAFASEYDVVYHASNGWRLISDTIEALYEARHGPLPPDMVLLRDPYDPDILDQTALEFVVGSFVSQEVTDTIPEIAKRLLSVNPSLFASCYNMLNYQPEIEFLPNYENCSPLYWKSQSVGGYALSKDHQKAIKAILKPILARYQVPENESDFLLALYAYFLKPEDDQRLFQILIPRNDPLDPLTNRVLYLSRMLGWPLFGTDTGFYADSIPLEKGDEPPYIYSCFEPAKVLSLYKKNPRLVPNVNILQGRFLFSQESLHPKSGIRWITYLGNGASQERVETYRETLRQWAEEVTTRP